LGQSQFHNPRWFAVYSKPRQERIALQHLQNQGFECLLPMAFNPYQRKTSRSRKPEPLFPRYLFLYAEPRVQNLSAVRSTRGVIDLVRTGQELTRVPVSVIRQIKSMTDPETGLVALQPVAVELGDRVRVFDGPFSGLEGILQERCSTTRSLLLISMLGRETTVEVDSLLLQRAV
jgi:transcriptional antiterminator RfaH